MYQVLESYQRFNQKNNMIYRPTWDPSFRDLGLQRFETQVRQIEKRVVGFELKDFALTSSAGLLVSSFGTKINKANAGLTSWEPLPTYPSIKFPEKKPKVTDVGVMTDQVKRVARYLGADLVGIAKLDMRWVYSHHYITETGESKPVELGQGYEYVITMALEMNYNMIGTAPSALQFAEGILTYSRMAFLVGSVAQFIRQMGYHAIPALNDTALNVPISVDAGLGQLGRHGMLITPQFGPRQRLCKVITDLPLKPDGPIEFGVTQFCTVCRKCARKCPAGAISYGGPTAEPLSISNNLGVMKQPLFAEKCWEYQNKVGTNCGICIRVCPFNKPRNWLHGKVRWLVKHTPWIDRTMLWLDNYLGYGKRFSPEVFWKT